MNALTKPNEQTFINIASSPNAKASTAYLWVFVASLIQIFLTALVQSRFLGTYMNQFGIQNTAATRGIGSILISAVCGAPIGAAIGTLFFAIWIFIIQWIAKMFGGRGTTDQMAYAAAAITAPYSIIVGILSLFSAIPYVGYCFSAILFLAGLYIIALQVMAIKGVNGLTWGATIGTWLIPGLVLGLICACLVGVSMAALLPLIRNASQNFQP
jgi:hypothetical protein